MKRTTKQKIGTMDLMDTVDITDPCYEKNVWCRMNKVPVSSGNYTCYVFEKQEEGYNGEPYYVNARIGIYKDNVIPKRKEMHEIGWIGVDAGMAGFFYDKPDYDDDEWKELCNAVLENRDVKAWINNDGFFADTGYGDGEYPVFAHYNCEGKANALEIICA